jgi:hypothetical protein
VLIIIQLILAHTGIAVVSALHGLNALVLVGLAGYLVGSNWAFGRRAAVPSREREAVSTAP